MTVPEAKNEAGPPGIKDERQVIQVNANQERHHQRRLQSNLIPLWSLLPTLTPFPPAQTWVPRLPKPKTRSCMIGASKTWSHRAAFFPKQVQSAEHFLDLCPLHVGEQPAMRPSVANCTRVRQATLTQLMASLAHTMLPGASTAWLEGTLKGQRCAICGVRQYKLSGKQAQSAAQHFKTGLGLKLPSHRCSSSLTATSRPHAEAF